MSKVPWKTTRLIGWTCKHGNVLSLPVLKDERLTFDIPHLRFATARFELDRFADPRTNSTASLKLDTRCRDCQLPNIPDRRRRNTRRRFFWRPYRKGYTCSHPEHSSQAFRADDSAHQRESRYCQLFKNLRSVRRSKVFYCAKPGRSCALGFIGRSLIALLGGGSV